MFPTRSYYRGTTREKGSPIYIKDKYNKYNIVRFPIIISTSNYRIFLLLIYKRGL